MEEKNLQNAIALRHRLHEHPELSTQETWTKAALMEFLQSNTNLEVEDKGPYFYAVYRSADVKRRAIAFRADIDALPVEDVWKPEMSHTEALRTSAIF